MKVLDAHTATITTATVEVRTLTISGRQVTLAVFRQLEERWAFDAVGGPIGELWGRVNYCGSHCGRTGEHEHVVWSDGDRLYRCAMPEWLSVQLADSTLYVAMLDDPELHASAYHEFRGWQCRGWVRSDGSIRVGNDWHISYRTWEEWERRYEKLDVAAERAELAAQRDLARQWPKTWETVKGLPQLFIAV